MIPTLDLGPEERASACLHPDHLTEAIKAVRSKGCVGLTGLLPAELIDACHASFTAGYRRYFQEADFDDALKSGERRYMVSVALEGPFNSPQLYANALVMPILEALLGEGFRLASLVNVIALPGAPAQGLHRDHPWLFGQAIDRMLPSYAIRLIVPLIDIDQRTGTTMMKPGSHAKFDDQALGLPSVEPVLSRGDCLLMDYRLLHEGTANRSDRVRPVLFIDYARPWFKDAKNYKKQPRLILATDGLDGIDPRYRFLFAEPLS